MKLLRLLGAFVAVLLWISMARAQTPGGVTPSGGGGANSTSTQSAGASGNSSGGAGGGVQQPASPLSQNPYMGSVPTGKATDEVLQISFKDAIERGLKYNLGTLLSSHDIEAARGNLWQALSNVLPNVTTDTTETASKINLAQSGFTKIHAPGFSFGSLDPIIGPFGYFDTRAYVSTPIFDASSWAKTHSARDNFEAAKYSYKDSRELVVLVVGYGYLQAVTASSRVETADAQSKTAEALYRQASDQHTAGTSPAIDALRAKVEFQTRQQQLIAAKNDYQKQLLNFARTIGLPAGQRFDLTEKIPYDAQPPVTVDEALHRAYAARADFQSAQLRVRAAEAQKRSALEERLPALYFDGNYGLGGPTPDQVHGTYQAVGSIKLPIFLGGKIHADSLQADANLATARSELENLRGQIDQDVRNALLDLDSSSQQVQVAKSNVDLANQTLDQARDRFVAGVTDNIEVVQAQDAVASANESFISSLLNYNVARISLARAQGIAETGVLEYLKGRPNNGANSGN
jgi:outer membrane protein TolC